METNKETQYKSMQQEKRIYSKEEIAQKLYENNFLPKMEGFYHNRWSEGIPGVPMLYRNNSFEDLKGPVFEEIIKKCKKWNYQTPLVCAILSTQNGIGKTHLAVGILKHFAYKYYLSIVEKQYSKYLKNLDDFGYIQEYFNGNTLFVTERKLIYDLVVNHYNNILDPAILNVYTKYDLLVIDDAFSSKEKDFELSRSVLFAVIDERLSCTMKPTILTSNLSLKEIASIDKRIASRIDNHMLIQIDSKLEDFRRNT